MYGFVRDEFPKLSLEWKLLFIFYGILIKIFDCMFTMICGIQLYQWLFTAKAMVKSTKITKASLLRPTQIPTELIRMQSTPLM